MPPRRSAVDTSVATSVDAVLRHWDLGRADIERRLPGAAALRCVVVADAGRFVLRQVRGATAYLDYQVRVLEHLAAVGFPYRVPAPLRTRGGAPYVSDEHGHWLVYGYVDGTPAPRPLTPARAAAVARLVAATDRALASFDLGDLAGYYRLPLFDAVAAAATFERATRWLRDRHPRRRLARLAGRYGDALVRAALDLPRARVDAVTRLATPTIYDDWHRRNVLARGGRLVALIDFDSLVEAPRIVDVQNALTHVLASAPVLRMRRLVAFASAYGASFPLSADEAMLVTTVMRDRLLRLVADLLDQLRASDRLDASARLAARLIRVGTWLVRSEAGVTEALLAHATGHAR